MRFLMGCRIRNELCFLFCFVFLENFEMGVWCGKKVMWFYLMCVFK